jgi:hypothetical protein
MRSKGPPQNNQSDSATAASPSTALLGGQIRTYFPFSHLAYGAHQHPRSWTRYFAANPKDLGQYYVVNYEGADSRPSLLDTLS